MADVTLTLAKEQINRMAAMAIFAIDQKLDESKSTIAPETMLKLCHMALKSFEPNPARAGNDAVWNEAIEAVHGVVKAVQQKQLDFRTACVMHSAQWGGYNLAVGATAEIDFLVSELTRPTPTAKETNNAKTTGN